jgi:GNAT superfamily N-acetyltransferase
MSFIISKITKDDISAIQTVAAEFWGSPVIIAHGQSYQIDQLPGYKAVLSGQLAGFLHFEIRGEYCEILTLVSLNEGRGIGTALLNHIETLAKEKSVRLIHLVTTNDNLHALGFYQRRGYHIAAVFPGQIEVSRQLKASIPLIGDNNIPIRDEIRLEKALWIENAT